MRPAERPYYPFLIVPAAALILYAHNTASFGPFEVLRTLAALVIVALVPFLVLRLVLRSWKSAGLATSFLAFGFLLGPDFVLRTALGISLCLVAFAIRRFDIAGPVTAVANAAGAGVVAVTVLNAVLSETDAGGESSPDFGPLGGLVFSADGPAAELPSVAHIVLDGYANSWSLEKLYNHDNSSFSSDLEALGFQVFENVAAPFNQTMLSMPTVLNAALPPIEQPPFTDLDGNALREALLRSTANAAVFRLFDGSGHDIVSVTTGFGMLVHPTGSRVLAPDSVLEHDLFDSYFTIPRLNAWVPGLIRPSVASAPIDRRIRHALSAELPEQLHEPFYLFSHILSPHPPFTLTRDGAPTDVFGFSLLGAGDHAMHGLESLQEPYRRGYVEKLRYTNAALLRQVEQLIARTEGPLLIIVHGDHGSGARLVNRDADRTCLAERMFTTAAIYSNVPAIRDAFRERGLRNIANIYRVVASALTGTEIADLDGQFFVPDNDLRSWRPIAGMDLRRNCT